MTDSNSGTLANIYLSLDRLIIIWGMAGDYYCKIDTRILLQTTYVYSDPGY